MSESGAQEGVSVIIPSLLSTNSAGLGKSQLLRNLNTPLLLFTQLHHQFQPKTLMCSWTLWTIWYDLTQQPAD